MEMALDFTDRPKRQQEAETGGELEPINGVGHVGIYFATERQHISDAAWERATKAGWWGCPRDRAESDCRNHGVIITSVEEWEARNEPARGGESLSYRGGGRVSASAESIVSSPKAQRQAEIARKLLQTNAFERVKLGFGDAGRER